MQVKENKIVISKYTLELDQDELNLISLVIGSIAAEKETSVRKDADKIYNTLSKYRTTDLYKYKGYEVSVPLQFNEVK